MILTLYGHLRFPAAGTLQPVPVPEFADHVNHLHANDDYLFSEEYSVSDLQSKESLLLGHWAHSRGDKNI